jgi:hypothetical protein
LGGDCKANLRIFSDTGNNFTNEIRIKCATKLHQEFVVDKFQMFQPCIVVGKCESKKVKNDPAE